MMYISPRNKYRVAEGEMANVFTLLVVELFRRNQILTSRVSRRRKVKKL